jgi:hypothetical protein
MKLLILAAQITTTAFAIALFILGVLYTAAKLLGAL